MKNIHWPKACIYIFLLLFLLLANGEIVGELKRPIIESQLSAAITIPVVILGLSQSIFLGWLIGAIVCSSIGFMNNPIERVIEEFDKKGIRAYYTNMISFYGLIILTPYNLFLYFWPVDATTTFIFGNIMFWAVSSIIIYKNLWENVKIDNLVKEWFLCKPYQICLKSQS